MQRKWTVLAVSVASVALLAGGLSLAADENETELQKLMEQVNKTNLSITKSVRNQVAWAKAEKGKTVVEGANTLAELGKKARDMKDALDKAKDVANPAERWKALMDDYIKASENLASVAQKGEQAAAKDAHQAVKKSCTECHNVFRVEDDF